MKVYAKFDSPKPDGFFKFPIYTRFQKKVCTGNVYRHNPHTYYIGKNTFDFTALVTEHA